MIPGPSGAEGDGLQKLKRAAGCVAAVAGLLTAGAPVAAPEEALVANAAGLAAEAQAAQGVLAAAQAAQAAALAAASETQDTLAEK